MCHEMEEGMGKEKPEGEFLQCVEGMKCPCGGEGHFLPFLRSERGKVNKEKDS